MRRTSLVLSALVVAHGLPTRHQQSAAESTERRFANARALDAELDGLSHDLEPDGHSVPSDTPDTERVTYAIDRLAKAIHGKTALGYTRCEYKLVDKDDRARQGTGEDGGDKSDWPEGYNCDQWTAQRIRREDADYLPLPMTHNWYRLFRNGAFTARKCRVPVTRKYHACPDGKFCAYNSNADAANNFRFATGSMRDMFRGKVIPGYCAKGVAPGMWEHVHPGCTGKYCGFQRVPGSPSYWKTRGIDRP